MTAPRHEVPLPPGPTADTGATGPSPCPGDEADAPRFLAGGGETGARLRTVDWSATPLGPPDRWSPGLKLAVRLLLTTRQPMFVFWGPEHRCFHNDACRALLGADRHPALLGIPGPDGWPEAWPVIGPAVAAVLAGGEAPWHEDATVPVPRDGRVEEARWTCGFSPLHDETAPHAVGGVLLLCQDATRGEQARLLAAEHAARRRIERLQRLVLSLQAARTTSDVAGIVLEAGVRAAGAPRGRFGLLDDDGRAFTLVAHGGHDAAAVHAWQAFLDPGARGLPVHDVLRTGEPVLLASPDEIAARYPAIAAWSRAHGHRAMALFPLVTATRRVRGAVSFDFAEAQAFEAETIAFLGAVTEIAAQALDRVLAHEAEQRTRAELARSEAQFRVMADGVPAAIWVNDAAGRVEFVNRAYARFFGVSVEQVRREGWLPLIHPEDEAAYVDAFRDAIARHAPFRARARVRRADGRWRWIESAGAPWLDEDGALRGYVGVSPDVTEIVESQQALREADRRKDEFLAMLAHELRNPLSPLVNAHRLLTRSPALGEREGRLLAMIQRQTHRLTRLVDDLLEVSRIARGKITLRLEQVDLAAAVRQAVASLEHDCARRRHAIAIHGAGLPVWLRADPVRLGQVLENLITNACKYTPDGGRIDVSVEALPGTVAVRVRDTGIGIAPDRLDEIFEMFHQLDVTLDRAQGGLGIGLALARQLVALHGGTLVAESAGPGQGATFVVRLPRDPHPAG